MTHICCPSRRQRFPGAAGERGTPSQLIAGAERLVGFRLFGPQDLGHSLPQALAVSTPPPKPDRVRS
jgi:hypothetical protein